MPTTSSPLISIVIPTYEMKGQGVSFLKRCLDSIEKQVEVYPEDIEVVISDQSNNDAIEQFCETSALPVQYYRTTTGRGIAAHNLNTGIARAKGQYIKILFQDDLLVEVNHLATIIETIKRTKTSCILTGATHTRDGIDFYNSISPQNNPYFLFGNNTVSSPSVLTVAKRIIDTIPFDENLKLLFDCDFYFQLFSHCNPVVIIDTIFVANGVWDGQTQFAISQKQHSKEVRYLNWKYPDAKLSHAISTYRQYFANLHPNAPFPFDIDIEPRWIEKISWAMTKKKLSV
jgi:glycosyltransferase involved in cell wall biosynthesis